MLVSISTEFPVVPHSEMYIIIIVSLIRWITQYIVQESEINIIGLYNIVQRYGINETKWGEIKIVFLYGHQTTLSLSLSRINFTFNGGQLTQILIVFIVWVFNTIYVMLAPTFNIPRIPRVLPREKFSISVKFFAHCSLNKDYKSNG